MTLGEELMSTASLTFYDASFIAILSCLDTLLTTLQLMVSVLSFEYLFAPCDFSCIQVPRPRVYEDVHRMLLCSFYCAVSP